MLAPAQIVERVFRRKTQLAPEAIGDEAIQPGAFIHFVEMRHGLAREQNAPGSRALHRRAIDVVEQAFGEIAGGGEVFKPLLILNANGRAAEFIGQADRGDVHLALLQKLVLGQFGGFLSAQLEFHPALAQPVIDRARLRIAHLPHRRVER